MSQFSAGESSTLSNIRRSAFQGIIAITHSLPLHGFAQWYKAPLKYEKVCYTRYRLPVYNSQVLPSSV